MQCNAGTTTWIRGEQAVAQLSLQKRVAQRGWLIEFLSYLKLEKLGASLLDAMMRFDHTHAMTNDRPRPIPVG